MLFAFRYFLKQEFVLFLFISIIITGLLYKNAQRNNYSNNLTEYDKRTKLFVKVSLQEYSPVLNISIL